jgi:beta-phosphoglucomutase-like phosphatase (HAD superfamily)
MEKTAILFDMDGVLVDSEKVITKAAIRSLAAFGVTGCEADFKPFTGMGEDRFIGGVAQKYGVVYQPEMKRLAYEIYLKLVETELVVYPGTVPALQTLLAHGHPLVLASSADRIKIDANLRVAGTCRIPSARFYPAMMSYAKNRIRISIWQQQKPAHTVRKTVSS